MGTSCDAARKATMLNMMAKVIRILVQEENRGFDASLFFHKVVGKPKRVGLLGEKPEHVRGVRVLVKHFEPSVLKKCIKTIVSVVAMKAHTQLGAQEVLGIYIHHQRLAGGGKDGTRIS